MKTTMIFFILAVLLCVGIHAEDEWPVLKGSYLGQKPPGMTPEIFAPGLISTAQSELNSVLSPRGDEFYFAVCTSSKEDFKKGIYLYHIMVTKQADGVWLKPEIAAFTGRYSAVDMSFSPDGNRLYFCSDRPTPWNKPPNRDIWYCERLTHGWSVPQNPGEPLNSPGDEVYPTLTAEGTMYFASSRKGGKGKKDIYSAKFVDENFVSPVHLGEEINTKYNEGDTFVAPDESYLLVTCKGRPDHWGGDGIYFSMKNKDGSWKRLKNIYPSTKITGGCPMVSPDGKYLFFSRGGDIHWVDAKIIETLKSTNQD